jgi:hypothetical protein
MKKECLKCKEMINLDEERYVLLATYEGKNNKESIYFHLNCWKKHFEEKAREKAQAVVKGMQEKIMPIAQGILGRFKEQLE